MDFTNYLSKVVQGHGMPNFTNEGFKTIMNIVHLEGRLRELELMEKRYSNTHFANRFGMDKLDVKVKIKGITNGKTPIEMLRTLCE